HQREATACDRLRRARAPRLAPGRGRGIRLRRDRPVAGGSFHHASASRREEPDRAGRERVVPYVDWGMPLTGAAEETAPLALPRAVELAGIAPRRWLDHETWSSSDHGVRRCDRGLLRARAAT